MMDLSNDTNDNNTYDKNTQYDDNMPDLRSKYQTILAALFLLITIIFGLLGNTAVIAVVCMQRTMRREASNLLIVNLCITDLSNTVFVMSSAFIALVSDEWTLGTVWCDCICAINYCLIIVSMLTLCCISLDRYQAVMYPLLYRIKIKRKHMMMVIIYTWIQGITFGLAPSVSGWVSYDYWEAICAIQWHLYHPDSVIYVVLAFALCFLIPGIILIHCYVKILKEVKKQKAHLKFNVSGDSQTNERNKRKVSDRTKIVWSLLVVVLAYFICTTPFSVTKLIKVIVHDTNFIPGPINLTASLLGYVASAINPLIYGIFRRDFRTAYKNLLCTVLLGRKYPADYDMPTSASHTRTITQANHCTNHEEDMNGLESVLHELEKSKKMENRHPSPILPQQFKHPSSTVPIQYKNSSPTLPIQFNNINFNREENINYNREDSMNYNLEDGTNYNREDSTNYNREDSIYYNQQENGENIKITDEERKLKNHTDTSKLESTLNALEISMKTKNEHFSQTLPAQLFNNINYKPQDNGNDTAIREEQKDDGRDSTVSFKQINVRPVPPVT